MTTHNERLTQLWRRWQEIDQRDDRYERYQKLNITYELLTMGGRPVQSRSRA